MQSKDRQEFRATIEALCATFGAEPTEPLLEGYWIGLADIPIETVVASAGLAIRTSKFMPRPCELRGDTGAESKAIDAWPEVLRLARKSSGEHSDPIAREAIRLMGGGKRLGAMATQDLAVWGRKEFDRFYAELSDRVARGHTLELGGCHDAKQIGGRHE